VVQQGHVAQRPHHVNHRLRCVDAELGTRRVRRPAGDVHSHLCAPALAARQPERGRLANDDDIWADAFGHVDKRRSFDQFLRHRGRDDDPTTRQSSQERGRAVHGGGQRPLHVHGAWWWRGNRLSTVPVTLPSTSTSTASPSLPISACTSAATAPSCPEGLGSLSSRKAKVTIASVSISYS
jgi:hypothetical protein